MIRYIYSPTVWVLLLGSFLITYLLTPLVMRLANRFGILDGGGYRRIHKDSAIPLMGGLAIAIPFIGACLCGIFKLTGLFRIVEGQHLGFIALALGCGIIVIMGIIDDKVGLRAPEKFALQILAALMICGAGLLRHSYIIRGIDFPFLGRIELGPFIGTMLTIIWIVGLTNAYNLIDGLDGLATGLALIAAIGLAIVSFMNGSMFPALLCTSLSGSLMAFLCFNFHPAKIFLGDTGSLFLGFTLASVTLMGSLKSTGAVIFITPILVLGLPIVDTLSSIVRRMLRGRPLFQGDQGHLHHRLLNKGYSHRATTLIFYAVSILMTASAILSWVLPPYSMGMWAAYASYGGALIGVAWLADLLRIGRFRQIFRYRKRNKLLSSFANYVSAKLSIVDDVSSTPQALLGMMCDELRLSSLEVHDESGRVLLSSDETMKRLGLSILPAGRGSRFQVKTASGQPLIVCYQHNDQPNEIEYGDTQACLAHIFEEVKWDDPGRFLNGARHRILSAAGANQQNVA